MGTALTLWLACAPILVHAARPDRNAYLDHTVTSVSGLIAEVKKDPQVADRYMRHFGMTRKEVIAMFSKLHVARLGSDMPVKMYSVPSGGYIKVHATKLRKGELVFEDAKGRVVLKLKCGNPVVRGKLRVALNLPHETLTQTLALRPIEVDQGPPVLSAPVAEIVQPETKPDVSVPVTVAPPITSVTTPPPTATITKGSSPNLAALLVSIPLLAAAGITLHNHSAPIETSPPPTPEPMSMLLLAGGASGLLVYRRRRARS